MLTVLVVLGLALQTSIPKISGSKPTLSTNWKKKVFTFKTFL
jgi:hypothetical protein